MKNENFKGKTFRYYIDLTKEQKEKFDVLFEAAKRLYNCAKQYREDDYAYAKNNAISDLINEHIGDHLLYSGKYPNHYNRMLNGIKIKPLQHHFKYGHAITAKSKDGCLYDKCYTPLKEWESIENPYGGIQNLPSSMVLGVINRVDNALKNFFEGRADYPKYHKEEKSICYAQIGCKLKDGGILYIPKFGDCKLSHHRPTPENGKIKSVTFNRSSTGKYYANIFVEYSAEKQKSNDKVIALDRNIKLDGDNNTREFATGWDGESDHQIAMPTFWRNDEHDIARVQRKMSKFKKGSPEWKKSLKALQHIYERVENRKRDWLHKQSRDMINKFGTIILEDLNIVGMTNKEKGKKKASKKKTKEEENESLTISKQIRRGFSESSHSRFLTMLEQKANEYGNKIVMVPPQYTSMTCNNCGFINHNLNLGMREWICPKCDVKHNRDLNAAKNIYNIGIREP